MTNTTATMRQDRVLNTIADLESTSVYVHDLLTQLDPQNQAYIKIANYSDPTVNTTFGTAVSVAAAPSKSELVISVDKEKWTNELIDRADEVLDLNGTAIDELTKKHVRYCRTHVEKDVLDYLAFGQEVSSGSNTVNPAGDTITTADWRTAQAALSSKLGIMPQNLMFVIDPYMAAGVRELGTFELDKTVTGGSNQLGVRQVGVLDGVPVFESQALPGSEDNRKTFTVTSIVSGATNSLYTTATLGTHHCLEAGMPVTLHNVTDADGINTGTFNLTSVTETTVILPLSSSVTGGSSTTLRLEACVNLLIAKDHAWFAPKFMLDPKFVDTETRHGVALQVGSLYGRGARPNYVKRILSPYTSLTTRAVKA